MLRRALPACLLILVLVPTAGARPHAHAAKSCSLTPSEQQNLGTTYVLKLSAKHVSCAKAKSIVRSFHACRHQHGKAGRCTTKVQGYACSENRGASSPVQYDSVATCTKGSKKVKHTYTQNT